MDVQIHETARLILTILSKKQYTGFQLVCQLSSEKDDTFQEKQGAIYALLHYLVGQNYLVLKKGGKDGGTKSPLYGTSGKGKRVLAENKQIHIPMTFDAIPKSTCQSSRIWCKEASGYIKFKLDQYRVAEELSDHLEQAKNQIGDMVEAEAEALAVSQMGDSAWIGKLLKKQHNPWVGRCWLVGRVAFVICAVFFVYSFIKEAPSGEIYPVDEGIGQEIQEEYEAFLMEEPEDTGFEKIDIAQDARVWELKDCSITFEDATLWENKEQTEYVLRFTFHVQSHVFFMDEMWCDLLTMKDSNGENYHMEFPYTDIHENIPFKMEHFSHYKKGVEVVLDSSAQWIDLGFPIVQADDYFRMTLPKGELS